MRDVSRKNLVLSIFVILILMVYTGCRRTEEILPKNNPHSKIPNQGIKTENSEKEQFVQWEVSHWERIIDKPISAFAINPEDNNIIYAAVSSHYYDSSGARYMTIKPGLWKSEDGGKHWSILLSFKNLRYGSMTIDGIYVEPGCPKNIWITTHGAGLLFSPDGGITWKKDLQKNENDILKMYNDSFNNKNLPVVYMYKIPEVNSDVGTLFSSLDSGKTWKRTSLPPLSGIALKPLFVDRANPNVIYAFGNTGLFKTAEGKGNYEYYPVEDSENTSYIYIDPQNPNLLYIVSYSYQTYNPFTAFKSSDCGKTWEKMGNFYFNPLYPDLLVKAMTTKETSPVSFLKKLYVSLDNGKNWKSADLNLNKNNLYSISMGGESIIYGETDNGLFRSEDKGLHWFQIPNFKKNYWGPISAEGCFNSRILIDYNNPNIIYWASGLSKSDDGGKTWQEINIQHSKRIHGSAVAIDPRNHKLVYLGITGINDVEPLSPKEFTTQGIYKSINDGKTWAKIGLDGCSISAIAISPVTGIVYVGTFYNGLFKSKDSGKTWERINLDDDPHISISSLAINAKSGIVYVGIFGGGIFKVKDK